MNSHIQTITYSNLEKWKMLRYLILLLIYFISSSQAYALVFGVNIHQNTDQAIPDLMKTGNFKIARMGLYATSDVMGIRDQVNRIRANGGVVEGTIQISYQWNYTCPQDFETVEQNAYNETTAIVNQYKDIIHDYELLNEISLRSDTKAQVPWNSAGTSTEPYENSSCYATMASVLRGMSRAIHDIRASSGYPLRVILGAIGRDFGFLTFMQQKGVNFDVVGYHIYPRSNHRSLLDDPWFGTGGLLVQLAAFSRPVHINEFNCGEIYDSSYDNQANSDANLACFQAYKKHLSDLYHQNIINLEYLLMYELLDEPRKSDAEARFGLMYDLNNPKDHFSIITAFAGGTLSASEQQKVTSLGILTDAEIAAYKIAGGTTLALEPPMNLRFDP